MSQEIAPWVAGVAQAKNRFIAIADERKKEIAWAEESMFAKSIIEASEKLPFCTPESIRDSVIQVASIGLSLNPALNRCYLIPRGNICKLSIGYLGLSHLAQSSGAVRYVRAGAVYENDSFEWRGQDEKPLHKFDPFSKDRGALVGAYCYIKTNEGDYLSDAMNKEEIERARKMSKASNSPAWKLWYAEMAKKVVIRRAYKLWPSVAQDAVREAIELMDENEGIDFNQSDRKETYYDQPHRKSEQQYAEPEEKGEVIEGESVEVKDPISDTAIRILSKKLAAHKKNEADLFAAFNVNGWTDFEDSQKSQISEWIDQ